ncbi:50S ribosomal protein L4 [bacterium]|nr:50S ribosomal protein L4 [bacterium]
MKVTTFTKTGSKAAAETSLDKGVFGREVNMQLLKVAYTRTLANKRQATAKTKTRGEIAGGGKKPWRQKGTGRARTGSIRNPIWRGGGTVFGPTGEQNYAINLPKKAIRASLAQALSVKAGAKAIAVIESYDNADAKVKATATLFAKMGLTGSVLLVVEECSALVQRATRNLPRVTATEARLLQVNDILDVDHIVVTKKALEEINTWLGDKK